MPSAAGRAERAACAQPVETITSTTIVITYGSAWKTSGGTSVSTPRAWSVNGSAEKRAEEVRADEAELGRQNAKMTSAIAIQPRRR